MRGGERRVLESDGNFVEDRRRNGEIFMSSSYGTRFGVTEEEEEDVEVEQDMRAVEGLLRAGYMDQAFKRYRHLHETHRIRSAHYNRCIKLFGSYDSLKTAWMVYEDICNENDRVDPDLNTHNTMMRLSADKRDTAKVKIAYSRIQKQKDISPNRMTYKTYVSGLAQIGEVKDVEEAMRDMEALEIRPDVQLLRSMMRMYSAKRNLAGVKICYNRMLLLGLKPDQSSYNMYIDTVGKRESLSEAEDAYKRMDSGKLGEARPDVVTYNTLIRLQSKQGRMDRAKKYYQTMISRGIKPNEITFTILMSALCKEDDLKSALAAFKEMDRRGVRPQINHYNALIGLYVNRHNHREVQDLYLEIRRLNYRPNTQTYNLVLTTYVREERDLEAAALYEEMRMQHVRPDRSTFGLLQRLKSSKENPDVAKQWFGRMHSEGVGPNEVNYALLIETLLDHGRLEDAITAHSESKQLKVRPKTRMTAALLRLASSQGDVEECRSLARDFFSNMKDWRVEKGDLESVIQSLDKVGESDGVIKAHGSLISKGWEPSPKTRKIVIRTADRGRLDTPDREAETKPFIEMIDRFGKAKDSIRAKRAFDRMLVEGVQPTLATYNALIRAHALAKDLNRSLAVLEELKQDEPFVPDENSYRPIILLLLRERRIDDAKGLLREASQFGIKVNLPRTSSAKQPPETVGNKPEGTTDEPAIVAETDENVHPTSTNLKNSTSPGAFNGRISAEEHHVLPPQLSQDVQEKVVPELSE